ncbi:unnamed protein product, partial [marine sediment metagenome]
STRNEIEYAISNVVPVRHLSAEPMYERIKRMLRVWEEKGGS